MRSGSLWISGALGMEREKMIRLKRLNKSEIVINSDLIQYIEETPDSVITMTNGHKVVVADSAEVIIQKVIEFRKKIHSLGCIE